MLAAFAASLAWALRRIRFGIDASDEGLYLAAPMRYALGDLPFRDEITNPSRMFDLVLAPLFMLAPDMSVYELRLLWVFVQFAAMLALFALMRRYSADVLVALAGASTMWLPNMIWTPGYHSMSVVFFVLGWSLWLMACLSAAGGTRKTLGVASGAAFFLGALSYLPLLALLLVPGTIWLADLLRGRRSSPRAVATFCHLVGFAAPLLLLLAGLAHYGLIGDWASAQRDLVSFGHYGQPLSAKFDHFGLQTIRFLPVVAWSSAIVLAMGASLRLKGLWGRGGAAGCVVVGAALTAVAAVAAYRVLSHPVVPPTFPLLDLWWAMASARMFAIALGFHLGALALIAWNRLWPAEPGFRFVCGALLTGTLIFAFFQGFLGGQAFKMMIGMLPLAVTAVVLVHAALLGSASGSAPRRQAAAYALICCLCLGIGSWASRQQWVYRQGPMSRLTAGFVHPRLAGIRSRPKDVAILEAVLAYLGERVRPGDFLIAYDDVPLLYYLTTTRPAIDHSWTSRVVPSGLRARSIDRMIAAGRVPKYAVRKLGPGLSAGAASPAIEHPIDAFVWSRYTREASFPPYEIWRLRAQ